MRTPVIVLAFILTTGLLVAPGADGASVLQAQSNSSGGVTVKAAPRMLSGSTWEFEIVFDTHSQELKDDLTKSASLVAGGKALAPSAWDGDPPGGHHRKGILKFNAVEPRPLEIELQIQRPGEPKPRSFRWQLN